LFYLQNPQNVEQVILLENQSNVLISCVEIKFTNFIDSFRLEGTSGNHLVQPRAQSRWS